MDPLVMFIMVLVPAALVLYGAFLLVRTFIQKEIDLKKLEVRSRSIETVLPTACRPTNAWPCSWNAWPRKTCW